MIHHYCICILYTPLSFLWHDNILDLFSLQYDSSIWNKEIYKTKQGKAQRQNDVDDTFLLWIKIKVSIHHNATIEA